MLGYSLVKHHFSTQTFLLHHPLALTCAVHNIEQRFTKIKMPRTNGKAERVTKTLFQMRYNKQAFVSQEQKQTGLVKSINFYNTVRLSCPQI